MLKISTQTAWSPSLPLPHSAMGFPGDAVVKNLPASARDMGLIYGSGRFSGEGNGNRLQYSCLRNSMVEEPGRLQSMGSQISRHNLVTEQQQQSETIVKPLPTTVTNLCNILINTCESVQIFLYHLSVWSIT